MITSVKDLRDDPMTSNSMFLVATLATMGGLGFIFWVLVAHLYAASAIGIGTALITATSVISFASLLGLNNTFVRYLPTAADPSAEINSGLLAVFATAVALSTAYVLAAPLVAHRLAVVLDHPVHGFLFIAFNGFAAVNIATDSIFIAYRGARYNLLVDGLIIGGTKILLPFTLIALAGFGVFLSAMLATAVGTTASLVLLARRFGYRPGLVFDRHLLSARLGFSGASYVANLARQLPVLVIPLVVLDRQGAAAAGYFYVAYQVALLVFACGYSVEESLLAEGSHRASASSSAAEGTMLVRRAGLLGLGASVPAVLAVVVASPFVLSFFGHGYRTHAEWALVLLVCSTPFWVVLSLVNAILRLGLRSGTLIALDAFYCVAVIGGALALSGFGIAGVAAGWLAGTALAAVVGLLV